MVRGKGHRGASGSQGRGRDGTSHRDSHADEESPRTPSYTPSEDDVQTHDVATLSSRHGSVPRGQDQDGRRWIQIHPRFSNEFQDSEPIVRMITRQMKAMYNQAWSTWSEVPMLHKERMFDRFSSLYRCHPSEHGAIYHACRLFKDALARARSEAVDMASAAGVQDARNVDNVRQLAPYNPDWMDPNVWGQLCTDKWDTPEYKNKRRIASANRLTEVDGSMTKHSCGSVSSTVHRDRLEAELRRPPGLLEVYMMTHTKKQRGDDSSGSDTVQWVDPRSQRIYDYYTARTSERSGEAVDSSEPKDDLSLWYEVTGGQRKGRTIGDGLAGDPGYVLTGECSSSKRLEVGQSSSQVDELRGQLDNYQSQLTEEHQLRIALQRSLDDVQQEARDARERVERMEREAEQRERDAEQREQRELEREQQREAQ